MENKKNDFQPIIIYFIAQVAIGIILGFVAAALYGENYLDKANNMIGVTAFASYAIIAILLAIIYRKRIIDDIKRLTKKDVMIIVIVSIIWCLLNFVISNIIGLLDIDMNNQNIINEMFKSSKILIAVSTVLFAPFAEEMVFRYSLSTIIKNNIAFIAVSSIIFGAMHATNISMILYILMGLGFSITYIKTNKNIVASSIIHIINNLFSILSMFILL